MPTAIAAGRRRRVISLQADGSAMYTVQSLWTQARERLPVTTVIFNNRRYNILIGEYKGVGATPVSVPEQDLTTDIDAIIAAVNHKTKIIMLANPNNPTGSLLPATTIEKLVAAVPQSVVIVLDAAYAEYVEDANYEAGARFVASHPNVVMLRTL